MDKKVNIINKLKNFILFKSDKTFSSNKYMSKSHSLVHPANSTQPLATPNPLSAVERTFSLGNAIRAELKGDWFER